MSNFITGLLALIYGLIIRPIKNLFTDRKRRQDDLRIEFELRRQEIYMQKSEQIENLEYAHARELRKI